MTDEDTWAFLQLTPTAVLEHAIAWMRLTHQFLGQYQELAVRLDLHLCITYEQEDASLWLRYTAPRHLYFEARATGARLICNALLELAKLDPAIARELPITP